MVNNFRLTVKGNLQNIFVLYYRALILHYLIASNVTFFKQSTYVGFVLRIYPVKMYPKISNQRKCVKLCRFEVLLREISEKEYETFA